MSTPSNTERNRARRHAARDRRAFAREVGGIAALLASVHGSEVNRAIRHQARDIVYERRLEAERLKAEEAERLEAEEAERLEEELLEAERLEAERLEAERLKAEEAERLKAEEAERLKAEEAERLEAERLEAEAEYRRLRNRAWRHAHRDRIAAARLRTELINQFANAAVEAANNFLDGDGPFWSST